MSYGKHVIPCYLRPLKMVDITNGLGYLHSLTPPVAHGDLKSVSTTYGCIHLVALHCSPSFQENILLDNGDCAVLCDFGLSSVMEDSMSTGLTTSDGFKGSLRWCSPELLDNEKRSTLSDMWAWALCVLEVCRTGGFRLATSERFSFLQIATGRLPFYNSKTEFAIYGRILGQCLTREEYPELPPDSRIWETLEKCFEKDPTERPSVHECAAQLSYTVRTCPHVRVYSKN